MDEFHLRYTVPNDWSALHLADPVRVAYTLQRLPLTIRERSIQLTCVLQVD